MKLQGRDLSLNLHGDDVSLLQDELAQLGIAVPPDDRQRTAYGAGTREAVLRFQDERSIRNARSTGEELQ